MLECQAGECAFASVRMRWVLEENWSVKNVCISVLKVLESMCESLGGR